ncbi:MULTISPECIES: folate family ECF transporter S component [Clostridium]|uniref:Folate transporter FolT n=2 Tax=Clostridium TaxID=1485 RepID=A0A151ALV4_9CLOT|nr:MULTISPECIES: folate family ECF transporter S component [Clostridium]KYH28601.1 folate transporter FolT [Clostridium colicanis DSM 13634]PRR74111.1 Folate transporter FolT [Clostridium thermopalmarium DSM 5974]PVZ25439.1 ECF transporter S component (folate family) [Clostridium thermopalmarium DSM 5974]
MKNTSTIVYMALFIALDVVFTRFLSIQTPIIRIGFGFLPISLCSIMFGPIIGGITGAVADIVGMVIFPSGAYFPGFTLSAFVSGTIYGLVLHKKQISAVRILIAVALIIILVDSIMNTYWLSIITGKAAMALLMPRVIKNLIMFPIQTILIYTMWKFSDKLELTRDIKEV